MRCRFNVDPLDCSTSSSTVLIDGWKSKGWARHNRWYNCPLKEWFDCNTDRLNRTHRKEATGGPFVCCACVTMQALAKLSSIGVSDHFFQKQVEFKAGSGGSFLKWCRHVSFLFFPTVLYNFCIFPYMSKLLDNLDSQVHGPCQIMSNLFVSRGNSPSQACGCRIRRILPKLVSIESI